MHGIEYIFFILSGPIVGIFGGAGSPVLRAMMSKIVSADDQGKLTYSKQRKIKWIKILLASSYTNYTLYLHIAID